MIRFATAILALGLPLHATIVTFSGVDADSGPGGLRPTSDAAQASFLAAASSLGYPSVETFESATLGNFLSLPLSWFTLNSGGGNASPDISNVQSGVEGFNTTSGGERFLHFWENDIGEPAVFLTFDFPAPIFAFGAYFTGVGSSNGVTTLEFNDGAAQIFPLVETTLQSVQFFGFTSTVAINQLTLRISPEALSNADQIGVDDVYTVSSIPEPGTWALALAGLGLIARIRKSQCRRG